MKAGRASRTAIMVCKARAFAALKRIAGFDDPTALALLPDDARVEVEGAARATRQTFAIVNLAKRGAMMVARTMSIDDVVRDAKSPQVVILGAGLDGRAWRMKELADVVVFEVDHPDTQREKRARLAALTPSSSDIRFVGVDFTKDELATKLAGAGHDPSKPTTWIWEGVVMYLDAAAVQSTLTVVRDRSAASSRIVVLYHERGHLILALVSIIVRLIGEPLKSIFSVDEMRSLLARFGFRVVRDEGIPVLAARISPELGKENELMGHLRIVDATT
jgi:methyltransferase (TIGR00027 family)